MKRAREEGVEGLRHKPPPGALPHLSEGERGCLNFWLRELRRTGFEEMYGRVRVAEVIRREFGEAIIWSTLAACSRS
jgi:hypothetical protein